MEEDDEWRERGQFEVDGDGVPGSTEGHVFQRSENGVWLTQAVPRRYLTLPD